MNTWAHEEMQTLDLGDLRLSKRCVELLESLSSIPEASFPEAMLTHAATKATYRFLSNQHFETASIEKAHREATYKRSLEYKHLLALQDTTSFNYSKHSQTKDLGYLEDSNTHGFFLHSMLLCSETGIPLGLACQETWARPDEDLGKTRLRQSKPIEEKESYKWLKSLRELGETFPSTTDITVISDQESDIFEYFFMQRPKHIHLLLRARHERATHVGSLKTTLLAQPSEGAFEVTLYKKENQASQTTCLGVRYATFQVLPPKSHPKCKTMQPVQLSAILAEELEPVGPSKIRWLLLTTHPVHSSEDAWSYVQMYTKRWLIERYHYVLKSGCQLEALQLRTRERLERALALYAIAAWRLLWITYLARKEPNNSCEAVFETHEWHALHGFIHPKKPLPKTPPNLESAVRWLAQLGGFLNRKGDGEPGVKILWKGFAKLEMISQTWRLLQQNPQLLYPPDTCG